MAVEQAHFLLTYACNFECDHCFVYSSPRAEGTFSIGQVRQVLHELSELGTVDWVYFEGGEPFLFYPLMLEGIRLARARGFRVGIVTNGYWATSVEDADLWLRPLTELGLSDLSVSDDAFHYEEEDSPAKHAVDAARDLGFPVGSIAIKKPGTDDVDLGGPGRGEPITGGSVRFRGRAVETLAGGLPTRPSREFTECPYEDLEDPKRVHLDPYGNVHLCQGLSMGNMWETPLSRLVRDYDARSHPVCGPLVRGGPVSLAETYGLEPRDGYVDACHFCYLARLDLIDQFPEYLAPRQCYGLP